MHTDHHYEPNEIPRRTVVHHQHPVYGDTYSDTYPGEYRETATYRRTDPARHAYLALRAGFPVAFFLAGLDKFADVLVPAGWGQYLTPFIANTIGTAPFLAFVGITEMVVAIGVAVKPRIFAPIAGLWLVGIIANLLVNPATFDGVGWGLDIVLRDIGLAIGAFALARLSSVYNTDRRYRQIP